MKKIFSLSLFSFFACLGFSQNSFFENYTFSQADSLRGALRVERTCFDVSFYHLDIEVDPQKQYIQGTNDIHFRVVETTKRIQIDLFKNMQISKIVYLGESLNFERIHNAVFVNFEKPLKQYTNHFITVHYEGKPQIAKNPPWDGGFSWKRDKNGYPWIGVSCQGTGASLWWPNKDHLSDEPDSMAISVTTNDILQCVSNGTLRSREELNGKAKSNWFVSYPINNYNVTLNIAKYINWTETFVSEEDGQEMPLDFYVLDYNAEVAKKHFEETADIVRCFEKHFGKYPFARDGFALVETSYLGMEHQGAIAYGNKYKNGYLGMMPASGIFFDYIIVHEAGHEWFGNSLSINDIAEIWIHESFTTYTEAVFVEWKYDKATATRYLTGQRRNIENKEPMVGPKDVNWENWTGGDHYYKGSWMIHTLRTVVNNDELWWPMIKDLHESNKISHMTTQDIINHVNKWTKNDYSWFFEQYLYYPAIPTFEYSTQKKFGKTILKYRWLSNTDSFPMPISVKKNGLIIKNLEGSKEWQTVKLKKVRPKNLSFENENMLINMLKR